MVRSTPPVAVSKEDVIANSLLRQPFNLVSHVTGERDRTGPGGGNRIEDVERAGVAFEEKIHYETAFFDVQELGSDSWYFDRPAQHLASRRLGSSSAPPAGGVAWIRPSRTAGSRLE